MLRKITLPLLLVLALGVCVGGDCGGTALPVGLSATDVGCATKIASGDFGFELIVPCGFKSNNDFYTPRGNELFLQVFRKEPSDKTFIEVLVIPQGSLGSPSDNFDEFNDVASTGTLTSSFGVEIETIDNVNEGLNMRQFGGWVTLPDGNLLIMGVTGYIWDAATNASTSETLLRSVKFTQ